MVQNTSISAPVLKWAYGGCYSSWCETGWYSSPAVVNIDGDPQAEIIASGYTLWALDGNTGKVQWSYDSPGDRTWPGIVLSDLYNNGNTEIVMAQGDGYVTTLNLSGNILWQKQLISDEFRGLTVADLDGNNSSKEILLTAANYSQTSTWVLDASGNIRAGWPQIVNSVNGEASGIYNDNAAVANISGDSQLEIIVPTDMHYILGLHPDGTPLAGNPTVYPDRPYWGNVGTYENLAVEIRGYGACTDGAPQSENYRPNFAISPATIADLDGDGHKEVVVVGNVYDCIPGYPSKYFAPFIFNADRTRWKASTYDWTSTPMNTGAPLSTDYDVIESAMPNPVVADLDGDGQKEILYSSYDGRVHAFWLDKTEHGNWPFQVYKPSDGTYQFASEPVVADLNNDGKAEVIFTTWVQKDSYKTGKLYILDYLGNVLQSVDLPMARGDTWNGGLAAPTLANVDTDPDLELVVNTAQSGVVVYDLPGTANARILWGTGRGSYARSGSQ